MAPAAAAAAAETETPAVGAEITRKRLKELAQASGLQGLPTKGGEAMDLAAYSEAQQRLYFLGQDAGTGQEALHYVALSDLGQGVGTIRIGGGAGEEPHDRFYAGTRVTSLAFNPAGDRLLLVGAPSQVPPYLGVVDLRGLRQPTISSKGAASASAAVRAPHRQVLPPEVSGRLLQAAWHPLSRAHVVALLGPADGDPDGPAEVHVYDVESAEKRGAEAVLEVDGDVAAFCFGPDSLWQRFTLYLVAAGRGAPRMLALCPFVPQRAQVQAAAVKELQETVLEELALDKVQRRREELEAQWSWLSRTFGDVVALARDKGEDFLAFRWVTSRVSMAATFRPALQEVEYPDPPAGLSPRALGLLNPSGTLPALAVTYDSEAVDVLLLVSLVEPQWEAPDGEDAAAAHRWPLEARRLAWLKTGHKGGRGGTEALPRVLLDPERHGRGTVYVVRDGQVLQVALPWVRRIEQLGDEATDEGADGGVLGRRGPPGKARMREVHRIRRNDNSSSRGEARCAGACMVYDASVGSLLVVRRRDGEVDVINLAILPFVGAGPLGEEEEEEEEEGAGGASSQRAASSAAAAAARQFSNHVPLEAASRADVERLKAGYEAVLGRPSLKASAGGQAGLVALKQEVIEQVIIPLRALQTRMVVRADEVAVLYEKARGAAQALHERLEALRGEQRRVQAKVEAAERQLGVDQQVAALMAEKLEWVRGTITPREDRRFQEVQLAEARLRSLEERLRAVEEWAQGLKENGGLGEGEDGAGQQRRRMAESEEGRRRLAREAAELSQEIAMLERTMLVDHDDEEEGGEGLGWLEGFGAMRVGGGRL